MALAAAFLSACGGVSYVDGPAALGPYLPVDGGDGFIAEQEGELSTKDSRVARGTYGDSFAFLGEAGERLRVSLTSDQLDSYVLVLDGNGRLVGEDDDSGGGLNARLEVELPTRALYLVVATSYAPQTGPYRLRVHRGARTGRYPWLEVPTRLQRRFAESSAADSEGNPYHVYALDLRADGELSVGMTSGQADALLRLYDASGLEVATDDDSGGDLNAHLHHTPAVAGRYYLVATTYTAPRSLSGATYHLTIMQ